MKVTKAMLRAQVEFLNKNLNRPATAWTKQADGKLRGNIGNFHLAVNSPGDGWTRYGLEEVVTETGGVHEHFFGNGQDMWAFLRGVDAATRLAMFPAVTK